MVSRKIKLSNHCVDRAIERGIDIKDIILVANSTIETIYDVENKNYKSYGLVTKPVFKDQPYLLIIHSKFKNSITVITAMYKDKGGLRVHGFSKIR